MMERYSGDFLAAVDGLRALLGCAGRVWPVSMEQATLVRRVRATARRTRGEVEVDAGHNAGHAITPPVARARGRSCTKPRPRRSRSSTR